VSGEPPRELHVPRLRLSTALPWITTPILVFAIIAVWHFYVTGAKVSAFILPTPASVWTAWKQMIVAGTTWQHTWATVYETIAGFFWASIVGVALGVVLGRVRWLEVTLNPFIVATQVVPKVALVPLMIVWFGFGMTSKVVIAAVLAFFPILSNTVLGVKSVDRGHRDVMTSLNASRWMVLRRLELPSSLPYILTGMEVGVVLAIIGAVVGEFLGGNVGLGYLLVARMNAYETDVLFAVIVHMTMIGFLFYFAIGVVRRLTIPWHESVAMERAAP